MIASMLAAGRTDSQIRDRVLVSGAINPNGTVGRVRGVEEKAEAIIDFGASILLVAEHKTSTLSG